MILKAKPGIYAPALSAGLPTVSFRMPNHPVTLELIRKVGIPLVGPSAEPFDETKPNKSRACIRRYEWPYSWDCGWRFIYCGC